MELLLSYMYRGEINVQEQELMELLATAKSLQIKGLADSSDSDDAAHNNSKGNHGHAPNHSGPSSSKKTAPSSSSSGSAPSSSKKPPLLAPKPALKRAPPQATTESGASADVPDVKRIKEEAYNQEGVASTSKGVTSGAGPSGSQPQQAVNQEEEEDYEGLEGEEGYDEDDYGMDESGAVPEGGGPMIYEGDEAGEANLSAVSTPIKYD